MNVRFWGCRGSIPRSRPDMIRYGGNTSCVELRSAGGTLVALDFGSGAQDFGQQLLRDDGGKQGVAFITHTHWDHIQGLPFFAPLFIPGNAWDIYGPRGLNSSLRETLAGQMQYSYFPITLEQLGAEVRYHDLVEGSLYVDDVHVRTQYLNHPALTLGYRLQADGVTVVYATDHEPFVRRLAVEGYRPSRDGQDDRHVAFIAGADLLIHDAQYTAEEYPSKEGWGHSTIEYVVDVALAGKVRRLALFHHDPMRDDDAVDGLVRLARDRVREAGGDLEVFAAADRQAVELEAATSARQAVAATADSARVEPALEEQSVLIAFGDPTDAVTLSEAVREDRLETLTGGDVETALKLARAEEPSLLLVEQHLPGGGALEVCLQIRQEPWGRETPFVVVAKQGSEIDESASARSGVTDWLVEPYSAAYVRTRIRAWLLRAACRWQRPRIPDDEAARLRALHDTGIVDTPPEERFDRVTRIAAALFDVPIALVSLVDRDRQWFKSRHGLDAVETPRDQAFCAHAIHRDDIMLVPDALQDDRFADNPLVRDRPRVRFYAGCPISSREGHRIGTLCLIDHRARDLNEKQLRLLRDLGRLVESEIAARAG